MPEAGLKVDDLALRRGGQEILAGVSLSAGAGDIVELRGPNGAGKSSLLLALAGLVSPHKGSIVWSGAEPDIEPRTLLHYLGHQPAIKPGLTVTENLGFWVKVLGGDGGKIAQALDEAGLGAIARLDAGVLSAGQARRLALARLIAIPRPIWLLDEPTNALDETGAGWVGSLISAHLKRGGLVIAATHLDIAYDPEIVPVRFVLGAAR